MQSLSASANCTNGSRASRTFSGITSFTFCPKLGLEHLGNRVPILFTRPRVALNQLGPCCHQRLPRSQHHQVLPHLSTAVPYRVQRLWIHPPQPRQLLRIDPIILALTSLRPLHQPWVGHHHLVSLTRDDFLHPG